MYTSTFYRSKEELKAKIDQQWNLYNAMLNSFMQFAAKVNQASGAANITDSFSPKVFVESADQRIDELEECIKRYRASLPQDFEGVTVRETVKIRS